MFQFPLWSMKYSGLGCLFKTRVTITGQLLSVLWHQQVFYGYEYSTPVLVTTPDLSVPFLFGVILICQYFLLVPTATHKHKYNKHKDNGGISQGGMQSVATLNHLPPCEDWATPWCSGLLLWKHRHDIFTGFLLVSWSGGGRERGVEWEVGGG